MSTTSQTPSLTPSRSPSPTPRSPSPTPPIQPDHFYGSEGVPFPPSPDSQGRTWLDPDDDPLASRGIPVFKPTLEEFQDFEGYMTKVECWGMRSGIVKVIPPKEWKDALPSVNEQLASVKLKNPIEQHMIGRSGLFHQRNIEKRRIMSIREWVEQCNKEDWRAPGVDDVGLRHAPRNPSKPKSRRGKTKADATPTAETAEVVQVKTEPEETSQGAPSTPPITPLHLAPTPAVAVSSPDALDDVIPNQQSETIDADIPSRAQTVDDLKEEEEEGTEDEEQPGKAPALKVKGRRQAQTREAKEAQLKEREAKDVAFLEDFDPVTDWLPPNTLPSDYTPEFCQKLERQYWRNCGLNKPAWYGADMAGSLFTDDTQVWNVAHLPSLLSRILPSSVNGLPGVNMPYLYFGMWRATFAWHVEDMDLFSINYIHFGAAKFWYAVPQGRANALEQTMIGYFPDGPSRCPQFLRHKSYLVSPKHLAESSCRPNTLVQHAGEFVITYPRGYHAGFNLGLNCAESVNFALDSWLERGRKARICQCISDSVRIDVDELLREREAERLAAEKKSPKAKSKSSRKRKPDGSLPESKSKKAKTKPSSSALAGPSTSSAHKVSVTLKLGPKPKEPEPFPCCLCVSMSQDSLLPVQDPPTIHHAAYAETKVWMAHKHCADVVPETWIDEIEVEPMLEDGSRAKRKVVFGVDAIVKDRWNLKCSACTKNRPKAHGAPIQCTKGKCPKAFHVSCAKIGGSNGIVYQVLRDVEKEVVLVDTSSVGVPSHRATPDGTNTDSRMDVDGAPQPRADSMDFDSAKILKIIKKVEILCLCAQHNPAVTEAKKAGKQDRIRKQLLALEPMARIKIRVSAGVFEVSLVRVMDETQSVEVVWDRGCK
ncbi:hypothetical protein EW146_g5620, partial [Bondarzewia mesenterica]